MIRRVLLLPLLLAPLLVRADAPTPGPDSAENCCAYGVEGYVFNDVNGNGVNDSEPVLAGWTVEVLDASNAFVQSTVTDAFGYYSFVPPVFCGVPFKLRLVQQPFWNQTLPPSNGVYSLTLGGCGNTLYGPYDFGVQQTCAGFAKTYTLDADFYQGVLSGVVANSDQLELSQTGTPHEFAWIANSTEGTISKVSTVTGNEVGRYYTGPPISGNHGYLSPSRTVVDQDGNCWVANRSFGGVASVTQILNTGGVDFNSNTSIETSGDYSIIDGVIQPTEMLPWGQDERVVRHYLIGTGPTDNVARGLALDKVGNLWVALFDGQRVVQVKTNHPVSIYGSNQIPSAPPEENSVSTAPYSVYGLALSCNGFLYGSTLDAYGLEIDPGAASGGIAAVPYMTANYIDHFPESNYGLAVDGNGIVWYAAISSSNAIRWDPTVGVNVPSAGWALTTPGGPGPGRGITVADNGNIWMACNDNASSAAVYDPFGNWLANYPTGAGVPIGIGVAQDGHMIMVGSWTWNWVKLNSTTGANISLAGPQLTGPDPYTYSDFTGNLYNITAQQSGDWTVITDGGSNALQWNYIGWNDLQPPGTSVSVEARTAYSLGALSTQSWQPVTVNGVQSPTWPGRYLETRVRLQREIECGAPFETPILYDLTVEAICDTCEFVICPEDTQVVCESVLGAEVHYAPPLLSSACDSGYTVSCTPPSGSVFPLGSTTVTCTATGQNLPPITCEFIVTVVGDCFPTPTGACCVADSCTVTTEAHCDQIGGIYFGDGSTCQQGCEFTCLRPPQGMTTWLPFDADLYLNVTANLADPATYGVRVNGPAYQANYVNNSLFFTQNDYVKLADAPSVDMGLSDFSVDCWVKTSDTGLGPVLDKRDDEIPLTGYSFFLSGGYPGLQLAFNGSWNNSILNAVNGGAAAFVADGAWHHIGVTVDRNNPNGIQFYVDGVPVGSTFNPVPQFGSLDNAVDLWVGASYPILSQGSYFEGNIDEVEIFKRVLTPQEMNELWLADDAGKCREACYVTDYATCCQGAPAQVTLTICNYDAVAHTYSWGLSPTANGVDCYGNGAVSFTPNNGTVTVPAGGCVNIPVDVPCNTGLPAGKNSCFQATIFNHDSGKFFGCTGSVRRGAWWCGQILDGGAVAVPMLAIDPGAPAKPLSVSIAHLGPAPPGPIDLPIEIGVFTPEGDPSPSVSLDGLPPGEPIVRTIPIPPGATEFVNFDVEYVQEQHIGHDILRLKVDDEMSGAAANPIVELPIRAESVSSTVGLPPNGDGDPSQPTPERLFRVLPNPFSTTGLIEFEVPEREQRVRLRAYDLSGRSVRLIMPKRTLTPGIHTVHWDGLDGHGNRLANGVYFLKLELEGRTEQVKVVLMR